MAEMQEGTGVVDRKGQLATIEQLLDAEVVLRCQSIERVDAFQDITVIHSHNGRIGEGIQLPVWTTPSLRLVYRNFSGLRLFHQPGEENYGIRLFHIEQVDAEKADLRDAFDMFIDRYRKEYSGSDLDTWLKGLIPIAEYPETGDRFCLDMTFANEAGECPVRFLDHEEYYGGFCDSDHTEIVAEDCLDMLVKWLTIPPARFLSGWQGVANGEFWAVAYEGT